ncbi:MAG: glycosyltransferase family 2 protein [Egibacteraceae bacterium]
MSTLQAQLRCQDNDYDPLTRTYERRTGRLWAARSNPTAPCPNPVSIVIPAHNAASSIVAVLDALLRSDTAQPFETVVVDDGSSDGTGHLARDHPLHPTVIALPTRHGAPVARNVGTAVASGTTVVYLDADMVLPPHVVAEFAARAADGLVLIGFRHNVPFAVDNDNSPCLPGGEPELERDHRVCWRAGPGRMLYSGIELERTVEGRPLDATDDLRRLGHGAWYYDWDLPRMVVTAMVSMPRSAMIEVGGFEPEFSAGWGVEDTHLGAKLIATGLKVAPLRQAVGFHIDPLNAAELWQHKLAVWPRNIDLYRRLLDQPPPTDARAWFVRHTDSLLCASQVEG